LNFLRPEEKSCGHRLKGWKIRVAKHELDAPHVDGVLMGALLRVLRRLGLHSGGCYSMSFCL
jgi:hypothetical protein